MSIFSSIGKALKGVVGAVAPIVGSAFGPVGSIVGSVVGGAVSSRSAAPAVVSSGSIMRYPASSSGALVPVGKGSVLPGAGAIGAALGGAALGYAGSKAVGTLMSDGSVRRRRRRRKGISATELKNHARVERFLGKNFKCKSGGSRPSHLRKSR